MSTPATVAEAIEQAAREGKQNVSAGGTTVGAMSVESQIAADRYLQGKQAAQNGSTGFRVIPMSGRRGGL